MDDRPQDEQTEDAEDVARPARPSTESVRIIGADEAAAAIEAGQAAGRRPDVAPRFGDVPPAPEGSKIGAVQINDVFVDDRGIVFTVDRHAGGLYALEMNV